MRCNKCGALGFSTARGLEQHRRLALAREKRDAEKSNLKGLVMYGHRDWRDVTKDGRKAAREVAKMSNEALLERMTKLIESIPDMSTLRLHLIYNIPKIKAECRRLGIPVGNEGLDPSKRRRKS